MIFTAHRVNTSAALMHVPKTCGVEIDLRDGYNNIILAHDPFEEGELLRDYLKHFDHAFLILNVKSERIEWLALDILNDFGIKNFFFLDSSFPMTIALAKKGVSQLSLRFSEFESLESIELMRSKVSWVWVDCFSINPLDDNTISQLRDWGLKVCIVSPELQGRPDDVESYVRELGRQGYIPDMVCSKLEKRAIWQQTFN
jgi:hypothetical protein